MNQSSTTVLDFFGKSFPVKKYSRILSLVPSLTEVLFSFGLEDSIIGVTKYCTFPEHAREKPRVMVGGTKNPDINKIRELKPDLILINQEENQLKHFNQLLDANLPVFVTFPKTVIQAYKLFSDLRKLFCVEKNDFLDELDRKINDIAQRVSRVSVSDRKKVFCPIWKKPWMSFNADTFASSMIEFCGGINVCRGYGDRYPVITLQNILEEKPNLILLPDEPYNFKESDKKEFHDFFNNNKVPNIELISGTFHWYSNKMIESLSVLEKLLIGGFSIE